MDEIKQHYIDFEEKDRLSIGVGLLEKERSKQIINKYLPNQKLKILDIGGAAGVYSFWLAEQGHEVHLADITPKHIEQANKINAKSSAKLASISVADATDLSQYASESFDLILLFGPLYHLVNKGDRLKALKECLRLLNKKGKLFAAGINQYASLYDGLFRGLVDDPYFVSIMLQDLKDGQHRNPKNHPYYFTTTIFQLPAEMQDEISRSGFSIVKMLPVEGPMWFIEQFDKRWNDEKKRMEMLDLLNKIEDSEAALLTTHHYIAIGEKS